MRTTIRAFGAALLMALTASAGAATFSYGVGVTALQASTFTVTFNFTPSPSLQGLISYTFASSTSLTDLTVPPDGVEASIFALPEFIRLAAGDSFATLTPYDDIGGSAPLTGPGPFDFNASGTLDCSAFAGGCSLITIALSFALTTGDQFFSTGTLTLEPLAVPEPGTLVLFALAAAALVISRRFAPRAGYPAALTGRAQLRG